MINEKTQFCFSCYINLKTLYQFQGLLTSNAVKK